MKGTFRTLGLLLASATCASALAAGPHVGAKTRAEVRGELMAALARGERPPSGQAQYEGPPRNQSVKSRAQVRNEVLQARADGVQLARGEAWPPAYPPRNSELTRDDVRERVMAGLDTGR